MIVGRENQIDGIHIGGTGFDPIWRPFVINTTNGAMNGGDNFTSYYSIVLGPRSYMVDAVFHIEPPSGILIGSYTSVAMHAVFMMNLDHDYLNSHYVDYATQAGTQLLFGADQQPFRPCRM